MVGKNADGKIYSEDEIYEMLIEEYPYISHDSLVDKMEDFIIENEMEEL